MPNARHELVPHDARHARRHATAAFPRSWWVALLLLTLVPRLTMAWKIDVLCPDGVSFIESAEALGGGDQLTAYRNIGVNTYPIVLMYLHRAGLDWELAGKVWGVSLATLTLLPLVGWFRRWFDNRVAFVSGFLYAVHPKLIEWSPELIRDQTFWFLAALTLYLAWRAAAEGRVLWYVLAGAALVPTLYTRFEGWFLLVPLLGWTAWRFAEQPPRRARLAFGLVGLLASSSCLMLWTESTWSVRDGATHWGPAARLAYVTTWYQAMVDEAPPLTSPPPTPHTPIPPAAATTTPAPSGDAPLPPPANDAVSATVQQSAHVMASSGGMFTYRMPARDAVAHLLHTLGRGFNPIFLALLVAGIASAPWRWLDRDNLPLVVVNSLVLAGTWIHLWNAQISSSRYALLPVLITLPFAALGLLSIAGWCARLAANMRLERAWVAAALSLIVGVCGLVDALTSSEVGRRREAALGEWLNAAYGPQEHIITTGPMSLLAHYSRTSALQIPAYEPETDALAWISAAPSRLLVLSEKRTPERFLRMLRTSPSPSGFRVVDEGRIPAAARDADLIVMERAPRVDHVAKAPRGATE